MQVAEKDNFEFLNVPKSANVMTTAGLTEFFFNSVYIKVQFILDCPPVFVSTEPVYSDDQFAHSYSNPYKLYINVFTLLHFF